MYEEQHLKKFCNWNYICKANGLGIRYYRMLKEDTLYNLNEFRDLLTKNNLRK